MYNYVLIIFILVSTTHSYFQRSTRWQFDKTIKSKVFLFAENIIIHPIKTETEVEEKVEHTVCLNE